MLMEPCKGENSCKSGCLEFSPLILMDFHIQIAAIRMGLSIIYFKGHR